MGPTMTVRDTGRDSMAERQRDICGPSVTSGAVGSPPAKETSMDRPTALTMLTHRLGGIPAPAQGLTGGSFGSCLSQKESYKRLPQSLTCR